jgi:hypothetical protein
VYGKFPKNLCTLSFLWTSSCPAVDVSDPKKETIKQNTKYSKYVMGLFGKSNVL